MMSGSDEGTLWAACPCTFRKVGVAGLLDRRALIVSPACGHTGRNRPAMPGLAERWRRARLRFLYACLLVTV